jgi:hypothetical protein
VERLHRTLQDLTKRCLVTLPSSAYGAILQEVQLTINTTYARSIGCAPYLLMFGTSPPSDMTSAVPDPTVSTAQQYAAAIHRQVQLAHKAATAAHKQYRQRSAVQLPPDPVTASLQVGQLAMIIRPKHNKLLCANAGPFLVTLIKLPHVHLQSLTHSGLIMIENVKNVRPLHVG